MITKKIAKLVKELNALIIAKYTDFKGCYLYGSVAQGTAHKNSDIDIVAIFDSVDWDKDFELSGILLDLIYKYDVYIDLHPYTQEELSRNPIYYNEVVNKGVFYGAI